MSSFLDKFKKGGGTTPPDLADDMKLVQSPIDNALICVCMLNGKEVCQYCFKDMNYAMSTEAYPLDKNGNPSGSTRIKVHARCHEEYRQSGKWAEDGVEPKGLE